MITALRLGLRAKMATTPPPTALLPPPLLPATKPATENRTAPLARPPTAMMLLGPTLTKMLGLSKLAATRQHPGLENLTTP